MPVPNMFGPGFVGDIDGDKLDANFRAITSGASSIATNNMVARAGGGQANATPITTATSRFTVVATAGDSAQLQLAAGQTLRVINATANPMNVFALNGSTDTINQVAGTTAFSAPAGKVSEFISAGAGIWNTLVGA